jgi:hypothetical protein
VEPEVIVRNVRSDEAEDRLRKLLLEAGVDLDRPTPADVERTWAAWREFATEPVEDCQPAEEDGDGILAQYGPARTAVPVSSRWT